MKLNLNPENINYIKIDYKDKNDFAHCVKAAIKSMDDREILASARFEEGISINTPQDIKLNIACDNGLYTAEATLKYINYEDPYVLFVIKTPDKIDYRQNREYFRVKIDENALISYKDENGRTVNIPCETYDLSANGVRLVLDRETKFPETVHLFIYLPKKTIETDAKYIRIDNDDKILKASFNFINLQDSDLDCISQTCFQKQLEARRKNIM